MEPIEWIGLGLGILVVGLAVKYIGPGLSEALSGTPTPPTPPPPQPVPTPPVPPAPAPQPPLPPLSPFNVWAGNTMIQAKGMAKSTDCDKLLEFWWETKATFERYPENDRDLFGKLNNDLLDEMNEVYKQIKRACSEGNWPPRPF